MKCGENIETDDAVLHLDARCMPEFVLAFDGSKTWTYRCSAFCAAFGRCVAGRPLTIQERESGR